MLCLSKESIHPSIFRVWSLAMNRAVCCALTHFAGQPAPIPLSQSLLASHSLSLLCTISLHMLKDPVDQGYGDEYAPRFQDLSGGVVLFKTKRQNLHHRRDSLFSDSRNFDLDNSSLPQFIRIKLRSSQRIRTSASQSSMDDDGLHRGPVSTLGSR